MLYQNPQTGEWSQAEVPTLAACWPMHGNSPGRDQSSSLLCSRCQTASLEGARTPGSERSWGTSPTTPRFGAQGPQGGLGCAVAAQSRCNLLGHCWSTGRSLLMALMCWINEPPCLPPQWKPSKAVACTLGTLTVEQTNGFNYLQENVIHFPALQLLNLRTCVFLKGQLLFSFHSLFLGNVLSGNLWTTHCKKSGPAWSCIYKPVDGSQG